MRSAPDPKQDNSLPQTIDMTWDEFQEIYPDWILWRATGRRFLPTEIRGQPQRLMDGLLLLDGISGKIERQVLEQMSKEK